MAAYTPGAYASEEIASQGRVWSELLPLVTRQSDAILRLFDGAGEILCVGCGSGLNAARCAAALLQMQAGLPARAVPAADIYLFPVGALLSGRKVTSILFSRSGQTTETVRAMRHLREHGVSTLAVTCDGASPLAVESDLALALAPAHERSVVTTRSLTGMILAAQLVAATLSPDAVYSEALARLPVLCQTLMPVFREIGQRIGQRSDLLRYAFLGSGPFYGLARESQLKLKEMVLLPSDAYPVLDFRHGPMSNVDPQTLVTVFISDSARREEVHVLLDMKALGGVTWVVCERADDALRSAADYLLEVNAGMGELARLPLYLPAVHFMAHRRALSLGLNPDQPRNLTYWVDTSK